MSAGPLCRVSDFCRASSEMGCQPYAQATLYAPEHYFSLSCTHFCWKLGNPQGLVWPKGLGKLKKFIHLIGSQTHDLQACSIVP
jgi:hypothetical protein